MCNHDNADEKLKREIDVLKEKIKQLDRIIWLYDDDPNERDQIEKRSKLVIELEDLNNLFESTIRWYLHGKLQDPIHWNRHSSDL